MDKRSGMTEQTINELYRYKERELRDILDAKLTKASISYEWRLMVLEHIVMKISGTVMSICLGGLFVYRGFNEDSLGTIIFGFMFSFMLYGMNRYLFFQIRTHTTSSLL
ncbi:hypothetical protein PE36_12137 [Moritella sp. PE36]|nr:hypothetical protein PE36_12137 [Moritella sp. PE36]